MTYIKVPEERIERLAFERELNEALRLALGAIEAKTPNLEYALAVLESFADGWPDRD